MSRSKLQVGLTVLVIIGLVTLLTGCNSLGSKLPQAGKNQQSTEITLTPVDLFKGENKIFQPFLGNMSGAFKLSYKGKRPYASLDIDIWKNGKKVSTCGSIDDVFFSSNNQSNQEVEMITSILPNSIAEQAEGSVQIKVDIVNDSGSSLSTFTVPKSKNLSASGLLNHQKSFTFSTNKPVYLWGMQSTSSNAIRTLDLSDESFSKLEWGIVFTLKFDKS